MAFYEITVRGRFGPRVSSALGEHNAQARGNLTVLQAELGSAALGDVLGRIRDLRLELVDVRLVTATEMPGPAA